MRFLRASPPSHHGAVYMLCSHCVDIVHPRHTYASELREVISREACPDLLSGAELMGPGGTSVLEPLPSPHL